MNNRVYKNLRWFCIVLLTLNGLPALAGGYGLFSDPSGKGVGMPIEVLRYSPFNDFFIPGLVLFVCNGIFSIAIIFMVYKEYSNYTICIIFEGCILGGWIVIQILMLREFNLLHFSYGVIAIALISSGFALYKANMQKNKFSSL